MMTIICNTNDNEMTEMTIDQPMKKMMTQTLLLNDWPMKTANEDIEYEIEPVNWPNTMTIIIIIIRLNVFYWNNDYWRLFIIIELLKTIIIQTIIMWLILLMTMKSQYIGLWRSWMNDDCVWKCQCGNRKWRNEDKGLTNERQYIEWRLKTNNEWKTDRLKTNE